VSFCSLIVKCKHIVVAVFIRRKASVKFIFRFCTFQKQLCIWAWKKQRRVRMVIKVCLVLICLCVRTAQAESWISRVLIVIASAVCYLLFVLTLPMSLCIGLKVCWYSVFVYKQHQIIYLLNATVLYLLSILYLSRWLTFTCFDSFTPCRLFFWTSHSTLLLRSTVVLGVHILLKVNCFDLAH